MQPHRLLESELAVQELCSTIGSRSVDGFGCPTFIDFVPQDVVHVPLGVVWPTRLVTILKFQQNLSFAGKIMVRYSAG